MRIFFALLVGLAFGVTAHAFAHNAVIGFFVGGVTTAIALRMFSK